jgi:hypothetical protein
MPSVHYLIICFTYSMFKVYALLACSAVRQTSPNLNGEFIRDEASKTSLMEPLSPGMGTLASLA